MTTQEIEVIAKWSEAKEVQTRYGPKMLRKAKPTDAFSALWKSRKEDLKALGLSWSKDERTGEWLLCWWLKLDDTILAERKQAVKESRSASAEIEIPKPDGLEYMPFQKAAIWYAMQRDNVLFADEMGLGKTIEAIGVINADTSIKSVLVICPKSLKLNWERELRKWLVRPLSVGVANGNYPQTDIAILSYEGAKKWKERIHAPEWDLCIADEAHYIKNRKAQRSEVVKKIKARRRFRITGTPIVNRPEELHNIINDLDERFDGFKFFIRYCGATKTRWGWDFTGAQNMDELQRLLRERIMVRRLKADVLTELPAKVRQIVEIEADDPVMKRAVANEGRFEQASEERLTELRANAEIAKADSEEAYRQAVENLREVMRTDFTEMARLRHETALSKVPAVIEHLHDVMDDNNGKKVVVAAHHHDVIKLLMEASIEAGWGPVSLTGEHSVEERQRAVDVFQNDPAIRLFIGSIMAAGVGITLTAANHVIFAELDWVPGNLSQFEDRCHRIGQKDSVLVQHLVLNNSLDARMAHILVEKQAVIDAALNVEHPERQEFIYEPKQVAATHKFGAQQIEEAAKNITDGQIEIIHTGLKQLAGMDDDYAQQRNAVGFNKIDSTIGHSLAERPFLTAKQAALGAKLLKKYHRQLDEKINEVVSNLD